MSLVAAPTLAVRVKNLLSAQRVYVPVRRVNVFVFFIKVKLQGCLKMCLLALSYRDIVGTPFERG
jgi:hypothetical protein